MLRAWVRRVGLAARAQPTTSTQRLVGLDCSLYGAQRALTPGPSSGFAQPT
jgi:hypothetical protein